MKAPDGIDVLPDLLIQDGTPAHIRPDNGPEFVAKAVRDYRGWRQCAFIEPGSPWENGTCEGFDAKLRDKLLNGEIFYSLAEAKAVILADRERLNFPAYMPSVAADATSPAAVLPGGAGVR